MNKLFFVLAIFFFLNNCSLKDKNFIWKDKEKKLDEKTNIIKVFVKDEKVPEEFNQDLKLDLSKIKKNNKIIDDQNNLGSQIYKGELKKIGKYKFSKLEEINKLDLKPIFLKDGIIFFDKKGSIIRYDNKQKVIWKKNHYSKAEKKLKPKINFLVDNQNLLVADSIAKYYSLNLSTGELNWSKNNTYPFNSDIKKYKNKIFVVDYQNVLRCFKIEDGSECWNLQTEDSFTVSDVKYSLIIVKDKVIFNNSIGDITAVDIETGQMTWQLPTQSSSIINATYNFKFSKLVSDGNSIFFSTNKNEFYSIDVTTGTTNWINKINSTIKSTLIGDFIFAVSQRGYLYVLDKKKGNIIRITDLFKIYKDKKRNNIFPFGFTIGDENLYLTNSEGEMLVISLDLGNIIKVEKISSGMLSEPFIVNGNLFVVRNGSIVQYN